VIPRPPPGSLDTSGGVGKIFVEYALETHSARDRAEIEGRQFANRTVQCQYMPVEQYMEKQFQ
jgi:hypothetical protein